MISRNQYATIIQGLADQAISATLDWWRGKPNPPDLMNGAEHLIGVGEAVNKHFLLTDTRHWSDILHLHYQAWALDDLRAKPQERENLVRGLLLDDVMGAVHLKLSQLRNSQCPMLAVPGHPKPASNPFR